MALDDKQRGVLRNMLIALAMTVAILTAVIIWPPVIFTPLTPLIDRFALTLGWDSLVLLCLVLSIGNLERHRFCTLAEMEAEPVLFNSQFGTYTNFTNLADLSALAVPAGQTGRQGW